MEQRITLTNLKNNTGNKILTLAEFVLSVASTKNVTSITGAGGIVIPVLSIVLSFVIGAAQPDYNPVKQTISQLVYYPQGWLQTTDFVVLGIWLILLALKCYANFATRTTTKIAAILLGFLAVGFLIIAICPTTFPGKELTARGLIHEKTAEAICGLFPFICCLLIPELKVKHYWHKLVKYTFVTAAIGFVLGILGGLIIVRGIPTMGFIERLIFLNAVIWLVVIGVTIILQKPVAVKN
jgi:hypothetical protein